jgi:nodulation protein E
MRRVVITGMGAICALGNDAPLAWAAMREGRSGIGPITNVSTDLLNVKIAAEVRGYDPAQHFDAKKLMFLDRLAARAEQSASNAMLERHLDERGRIDHHLTTLRRLLEAG